MKMDRELANAIADVVHEQIGKMTEQQMIETPHLLAQRIKMFLDEALNNVLRYRARGNWHVTVVWHGGSCFSAVHGCVLRVGRWIITVFYA